MANEAEVLMARMEDNDSHAALVFKRGRVNLHAVMLHRPPVRIVKIPLGERRYMRPLMFKGKPYPVARAARAFKRAGRELGITKGAAQALAALRE